MVRSVSGCWKLFTCMYVCMYVCMHAYMHVCIVKYQHCLLHSYWWSTSWPNIKALGQPGSQLLREQIGSTTIQRVQQMDCVNSAQLQQCSIMFNSCLKLFMVAELCLTRGISKQQQWTTGRGLDPRALGDPQQDTTSTHTQQCQRQQMMM